MSDTPSLVAERAHQPDDEYFDLMGEIARRHWWYRARRELVAEQLAGRIRHGARALDVGTGTGESLAVLRGAGAEVVVGTDLSLHALRIAHRHAPANGAPRGSSSGPAGGVLASYAEQLPFADAAFACLISTDVVEHLDDDVVALREYARVVEPGGTVLLTVPAYRFVWSEHDERAAHRRRYTATEIADAVRAAGLVVERTTHLFSFLVPPAVLLRCTPLRRLVTVTDDEVSEAHPAVSAVMDRLGALERAIIRRQRLPVGLSILVVAHVAPAEAPAATA